MPFKLDVQGSSVEIISSFYSVIVLLRLLYLLSVFYTREDTRAEGRTCHISGQEVLGTYLFFCLEP